MDLPKVGDSVKVHLPGESPWATCVAIHDDGTWEGRIDNRLFAEMTDGERDGIVGRFFGAGAKYNPLPRLHSFRQGQVVRFHRESYDGVGPFWGPAELAGGSA